MDSKKNKVESSEVGGFAEEESEEREEDGEECEEDGDKDEEGDEDEPNVQDEGEVNRSMESGELPSLYIPLDERLITLPIPDASAVALPIPGASLGDASSLGVLNDASFYGMTMYDTQPQPMYGTHAMYGGQDAQGTSLSLHSQGTAFPFQTNSYFNFMPGAVTPEFSFDQGFQWNNQAWSNNPAWNFGGLDSLPDLASPEPHEDSRPVLPSANPIQSTDDTSLPSANPIRSTDDTSLPAISEVLHPPTTPFNTRRNYFPLSCMYIIISALRIDWVLTCVTLLYMLSSFKLHIQSTIELASSFSRPPSGSTCSRTTPS